MQQRPEIPGSLNLPRRTDQPVAMPFAGFPMVGVSPGSAPLRPLDEVQSLEASPSEEGSKMMDLMRPAPETGRPAAAPAPVTPVLAPRDCTRVIIYGKANCPACIEAIQDLIDRQVCFTYHDVSRDEKALMQLQAICGADAMVPVIIQVGVRGG